MANEIIILKRGSRQIEADDGPQERTVVTCVFLYPGNITDGQGNAVGNITDHRHLQAHTHLTDAERADLESGALIGKRVQFEMPVQADRTAYLARIRDEYDSRKTTHLAEIAEENEDVGIRIDA